MTVTRPGCSAPSPAADTTPNTWCRCPRRATAGQAQPGHKGATSLCRSHKLEDIWKLFSRVSFFSFFHPPFSFHERGFLLVRPLFGDSVDKGTILLEWITDASAASNLGARTALWLLLSKVKGTNHRASVSRALGRLLPSATWEFSCWSKQGPGEAVRESASNHIKKT